MCSDLVSAEKLKTLNFFARIKKLQNFSFVIFSLADDSLWSWKLAAVHFTKEKRKTQKLFQIFSSSAYFHNIEFPFLLKEIN